MKTELIKEVWKPVPNYESLYDASNFGRVRSLKFGKVRILKQFKDKDGYLKVNLWKDGKSKQFFIHRLVYEAFNGEIPEGMEINHIDENIENNRLSNLEVVSHKDNINWGTRTQKVIEKRSKAVLQLTYPEGKFIKKWSSMAEADRNGFDKSAVWACCNGKLKQYKGFIWIYL